MNRMKIPSTLLTLLLVLIVGSVLSACGGGGGGGATGSGGDGTNSSGTGTGGNGGQSLTTGQAQITGTVQPDPADATANGQNANATVYVVGQQDKAVTTDANGNFTLTMDTTLSGTILKAKSFWASIFGASAATKQYGLVVISNALGHGHKTEVDVVDGQVNTLSTIYINTVGSISGKAFLQGATDHTGITVYIPGTSFIAMTAADGSYRITNVPSGTYDFVRAEKLGSTYHYAITSKVTVTTNANTVLPDMLLHLSAGPNGAVLINGGAAYTTSTSVQLSIASSDNAVLMMTSQDNTFAGVTWEPVAASKPMNCIGNFDGGGTCTVYARFAEASGLESTPVSASIVIDTKPLVTSTTGTVIGSSKPTLTWTYGLAMPNPQYHIQIASDAAFANIVDDQTTTANTAQYTYAKTTPLANLTPYYWRVSMIDASGHEWGWAGPWQFTVDLGTVSLLSPADGTGSVSWINDTTPTFTWQANAKAASYSFLLKDKNSNIVANVSGITATSYTQPTPLANGSGYSWNVTPVDAYGVPGTPSSTWVMNISTYVPGGSPTVTINSGNPITSSTNVTVTVAGTVMDMPGPKIDGWYISETNVAPDPAASGWIAIATPKSTWSGGTSQYTMSASGGLKTLYVWYKDNAGNVGGPRTGTIQMLNFVISTVDGGAGSNVGSNVRMSSANGTVQMSYYDSTNQRMKYAKLVSGTTWSIVSSAPTTTIKCESLAVESGGKVHLSCTRSTGIGGELWYLATNASGVWQAPVLVDNSSMNMGYGSIVVDGSGFAHISYADIINGALKYATNKSGSWQTQAIEGSTSNRVGVDSSIVTDNSNTVHIGYYDTTNMRLKYAKGVYSSWTYTAIVSAKTTTDVGQKPSLAIDKTTGTLHLTYDNTTSGSVQYIADPSSVWGSPVTLGTPGTTSAVFFDPVTSAIHVTFYNATNQDLYYATNAYGGKWGVAPVDTAGFVGGDNALTVTSDGTVHIGYWDNTTGSLKYAHVP
ncbi:MAG: hypothetical protein M0042_05565 [Nitrospiraceae bacterium]|nr:hypothetical protein [Nitrospiraceae bacterium]